jgi:hypothetical protein
LPLGTTALTLLIIKAHLKVNERPAAAAKYPAAICGAFSKETRIMPKIVTRFYHAL